MTAEVEPGFEAAYERLRATVEQLENGELPLEEALALYERGMTLVAQCVQHLSEAEVRLMEIDSELGAALSQLDETASEPDDPWEEP